MTNDQKAALIAGALVFVGFSFAFGAIAAILWWGVGVPSQWAWLGWLLATLFVGKLTYHHVAKDLREDD